VKRIISPEDFARTFDAVVTSREHEILALWNSPNAKAYTSLLLNRDNGIFVQVCERFGLKYAIPWWTIDAIFYESADVENFPVAWRMAKHICVAIEHENSVARSHYEINKLSLFNAPLKVLVTYPSGDRGRHEESAVLARYAKILDDADIFGDFGSYRRQLVVFGSRDGEGGNPVWRYHTYNGREFRGVHTTP
jgi:hypothetical protein